MAALDRSRASDTPPEQLASLDLDDDLGALLALIDARQQGGLTEVRLHVAELVGDQMTQRTGIRR